MIINVYKSVRCTINIATQGLVTFKEGEGDVEFWKLRGQSLIGGKFKKLKGVVTLVQAMDLSIASEMEVGIKGYIIKCTFDVKENSKNIIFLCNPVFYSVNNFVKCSFCRSAFLKAKLLLTKTVFHPVVMMHVPEYDFFLNFE